jgi:hypothetical protein
MAGSDVLTGAVLRGIDTCAAEYGCGEGSITSGITFIFETGRLTIANPFTLKCDSGGTVDPQSIIGCCVTASYATDDCHVLVFDGRIALSISLRAEDFVRDEAAVFRPVAGGVVVFK